MRISQDNYAEIVKIQAESPPPDDLAEMEQAQLANKSQNQDFNASTSYLSDTDRNSDA